MWLEDEQSELLAKFVEAHVSTAKENRGPFIATWPHNDKQATFFHSREQDLRFQGNLSDARILAQLGFLSESPGSGNSTLFSVLPQAIEHFRHGSRHSPGLDTFSAESAGSVDVFISYASEDRESIARPLYYTLVKRGWTVWFDEAVLELGDSLLQKIEEGLSKCRYGVVILSPDFFGKEWPGRELDGLVARETASGTKAILPVWHNINQGGVAAHSPTLAGRVAAKSSQGIEAVAEKVIAVLSRDSGGPANPGAAPDS